MIAKTEKLARSMGLSKAAAVERAVDAALKEQQPSEIDDFATHFDAILAQLDRVRDVPEPFGPLEWDELGLPR